MLHLFEAFGVELEYMIVDTNSLTVKPVCDKLIQAVNGKISSDWQNGRIAWSNELVMHVVEFKTNGPAQSWEKLDEAFHRNVLLANEKLGPLNCRLLPTAVHPFMDPRTETVIWPYDSHEVYELYDRLFGCKGHGWSNLQSMHINLPFSGDDEFGRLHAAIRLLMPMMPSLFASSPILDGKPTGFADSRMEAYRHNQKTIPSIAGWVVPEPVYTKNDYEKEIFAPIVRDIAPHDHKHVLDKHFLNSRGCIARFDRGAIEIRVLDLQESPKIDIALAQFLTETIKALVYEQWASTKTQKQAGTQLLYRQLLQSIKWGDATAINKEYLNLFGFKEHETCQSFWQKMLNQTSSALPAATTQIVTEVISRGCLSTRIVRALGNDLSPKSIRAVYEKLAACLTNNQLFTN